MRRPGFNAIAARSVLTFCLCWLTVLGFLPGRAWGQDGGAVAKPELSVPTSLNPPRTALSPPSTVWREQIFDFCRANYRVPAWDLGHCERVYLMAQNLARQEGLTVDDDVLFASAFLHDAAALLDSHEGELDPGARSARAAASILAQAGFPGEKIAQTEQAIREHPFYGKAPESAEGKVLRDADTLDLLGSIGVVRIFSLAGRHHWAPDWRGAITTLEKFQKELPEQLVTKSARALGTTRVREMRDFLEALKAQTHGQRTL